VGNPCITYMGLVGAKFADFKKFLFDFNRLYITKRVHFLDEQKNTDYNLKKFEEKWKLRAISI